MGLVTFRRVIAATLLVAVTGTSSFAEDYQCRQSGGCTATITVNGNVKVVTFRKGDLISTEEGWNLSTKAGWVKINPGRKEG